MSIINLPTTFVDNTVPTAAQFNGDFNAIVNDYNGSITNANISGSANIDTSKISGTAVNLSSVQTLTGKKTVAGTVQTITTLAPSPAATATCNLDLGNLFFITMPAGNITIALSNDSVGQAFVIRILQDGGGSRTVTWFSTIKWPGATTPTLTTTASKADMFGFICTGSGTYDGFIVGQNL
jgi:hypothetical protein